MTESKQYKAEESNKWGITTIDKPIPTTISKFDILEKITKAHEIQIYELQENNKELQKQIRTSRNFNIIYTAINGIIVFLLAINF